MKLFSFIHASDIHLDTPFMNISPSINEEYSTILRSSPFTALQNLLEVSIAKNVDFVLLCGDIYNGEDKSIAGQIALQKFARALYKEGIQLFIIAGNHDPLRTTKYQLEYPPNTFIFPTEYHVVSFVKYSKTLAYIHGVSHSSKEESRPLSDFFTTEFDRSLFHIGMLHCTVSSIDQEEGKKQYVPCRLQELQSKKINYWALGHIHTRAILSEYPHIVYCGNTQGIRSSEEGVRGVYYVEVAENKTISMDFIPTSTVIFDTLRIDLEEEDTLDTLFMKIQEAVDSYIRTSSCTSHYIFTLRLQGRTELDKKLRYHPEQEWIERIDESLHKSFAFCIQNIKIETRNIISIEDLCIREDLLGETMRILESVQQDALRKTELFQKVKEQIGTSFKVDILKQIDISIDQILENVQKECPYFFDEGK